MPKNKKLHIFFVIALVFVFTVGSVGVAIFASRVAGELQTSVVRNKVKKKKTKRLSAALVAQYEAMKTPESAPVSCNFVEPEKPEYKGEFIEREVRVSATEGEEFKVTLYLKNTGNIPWFSGRSGCFKNHIKLGTARDRDRESIFYHPGDPSWLEPQRISMVEGRVEPNEIATFTFISKAPRTTDIFREYFQPVVEGVQWMEGKETLARVDIVVGFIYPELEKALRYLGKTSQASSIPDPDGEIMIDVNITTQTMQVKIGEQVIREFKVSTGTFNTPTPIGTFSILNKQDLRIGSKWPHYHMPQWQGFTKWGHGLHSLPYLANDRGIFWNEALNHIGQRVSHGCIRILPDDAVDLYNLTEVGTPLVTHY